MPPTVTANPKVVVPSRQQVNVYDLASEYLTALGWPNTPQNQRALASWFRAESPAGSAPNTIIVVGNNPLNIANVGNYRLVGTHHISVFDSPDAGIAMFKLRIASPNHNYPNIVKGFKVGDGISAINAIIASDWVTGNPGSYNYYTHNHGRPGGHESNSLMNLYTGMPNGTSTATVASSNLGAWNNIVSFPIGHILTQDDVDTIMRDLNNANYFNSDPATNAIAQTQVRNILTSHIGEPWTKTLEDTLAAQFGSQAVTDGKGLDPLGIGAAVTAVFGKAFAVGVVLLGVGLCAFGLYLITKEATASGGGAESLVSPVPVFLREGA